MLSSDQLKHYHDHGYVQLPELMIAPIDSGSTDTGSTDTDGTDTGDLGAEEGGDTSAVVATAGASRGGAFGFFLVLSSVLRVIQRRRVQQGSCVA